MSALLVALGAAVGAPLRRIEIGDSSLVDAEVWP